MGMGKRGTVVIYGNLSFDFIRDIAPVAANRVRTFGVMVVMVRLTPQSDQTDSRVIALCQS